MAYDDVTWKRCTYVRFRLERVNDLNNQPASIKFESKYSKEKNRVFKYAIIQRKEWPPPYHTLQTAERSSKLLALKIRTFLRTKKGYSF